jgi:hypothetical protein
VHVDLLLLQNMELANCYLFFAVCVLSGVVAPPVIHNNKTANAVDSKENEVPKVRDCFSNQSIVHWLREERSIIPS